MGSKEELSDPLSRALVRNLNHSKSWVEIPGLTPTPQGFPVDPASALEAVLWMFP